MNDIHKNALNEILGRSRRGSSNPNDQVTIITEKDKVVRQAVAELYSTLCAANNPDMAIELLADHVAIMVDMINEFKGSK